jgi:hypothetical protein
VSICRSDSYVTGSRSSISSSSMKSHAASSSAVVDKPFSAISQMLMEHRTCFTGGCITKLTEKYQTNTDQYSNNGVSRSHGRSDLLRTATPFACTISTL